MAKDKKPPLPRITAQKADPEAAQWHKYQLESRQKEPERIEDAAKFLAGMISISLTIFLQVDAGAFDGFGKGRLALIVVLWLASLLAAFVVLFPFPYRYSKSSSEDIRLMHRKAVRFKYGGLILSAVLFLAALGILAGWYVLK